MARKILRLPEVRTISGLSRSTIYLRIADGTFVQPVSLGGRSIGFPSDEIETLISARIAGQSNAEIRGLIKKLTLARQFTASEGK